MYPTLKDFIAGWRRNVRAGLRDSRWFTSIEVVAIIMALSGAGRMWSGALAIGVAVLAIILTTRAQRRLGSFSVLGAMVFPFGIGLFCLVTALAVFDMTAGRPAVWKGRAYD